MNSNLIWTPQAREDLLDIYVTIGIENPTAAENVYSAIEEHISLLIIHPRMGVRRPEIAPSARMLIEGNYLILYETKPDRDQGPIDEVMIVRIVHGHRDLSRIF